MQRAITRHHFVEESHSIGARHFSISLSFSYVLDDDELWWDETSWPMLCLPISWGHSTSWECGWTCDEISNGSMTKNKNFVSLSWLLQFTFLMWWLPILFNDSALKFVNPNAFGIRSLKFSANDVTAVRSSSCRWSSVRVRDYFLSIPSLPKTNSTSIWVSQA